VFDLPAVVSALAEVFEELDVVVDADVDEEAVEVFSVLAPDPARVEAAATPAAATPVAAAAPAATLRTDLEPDACAPLAESPD